MTEALLDRAPRDGWRRWPQLLRLLGVAVPFVVALVCAYVDLSILLLAWLPFLVGIVGAAIFRSWWALLAIPLSLGIGLLAGIALGGGALHPTHPTFIAGAALFGSLALMPATIGAAIGVPLGHELEQLVPTNRSA